jgi:hypothetical protein
MNTSHDDLLPGVLQDDLGRAKHMAGGNEAYVDVAHSDRLAIGGRLRVLLPVAESHDRKRFGRRKHRSMPSARMVAMAVGDQRPGLGLRGIDPGVGRAHIDALGKDLDPGTQTRHCEL